MPEKPADPVVTFGRFNGVRVCDVPDWGLYALLERRLWPETEAAVNIELERRALARRAKQQQLRRAA